MEHELSTEDSAACINCGWRRQEIPADVREQVQAHLGKHFLDSRHPWKRIGAGKPPLSGWDRVKLRREGVRRRLSKIAGSLQPG